MKSPSHSQLPSDQHRDILLQSVGATQQMCRSHLKKKKNGCTESALWNRRMLNLNTYTYIITWFLWRKIAAVNIMLSPVLVIASQHKITTSAELRCCKELSKPSENTSGQSSAVWRGKQAQICIKMHGEHYMPWHSIALFTTEVQQPYSWRSLNIKSNFLNS